MKKDRKTKKISFFEDFGIGVRCKTLWYLPQRLAAYHRKNAIRRCGIYHSVLQRTPCGYARIIAYYEGYVVRRGILRRLRVALLYLAPDDLLLLCFGLLCLGFFLPSFIRLGADFCIEDRRGNSFSLWIPVWVLARIMQYGTAPRYIFFVDSDVLLSRD